MSQILLPWQRKSLAEKFAWHYSMAYPQKPHYKRKNLGDIFYTDRVIVPPKVVHALTPQPKGTSSANISSSYTP